MHVFRDVLSFSRYIEVKSVMVPLKVKNLSSKLMRWLVGTNGGGRGAGKVGNSRAHLLLCEADFCAYRPYFQNSHGVPLFSVDSFSFFFFAYCTCVVHRPGTNMVGDDITKKLTV